MTPPYFSRSGKCCCCRTVNGALELSLNSSDPNSPLSILDPAISRTVRPSASVPSALNALTDNRWVDWRGIKASIRARAAPAASNSSPWASLETGTLSAAPAMPRTFEAGTSENIPASRRDAPDQRRDSHSSSHGSRAAQDQWCEGWSATVSAGNERQRGRGPCPSGVRGWCAGPRTRGDPALRTDRPARVGAQPSSPSTGGPQAMSISMTPARIATP